MAGVVDIREAVEHSRTRGTSLPGFMQEVAQMATQPEAFKPELVAPLVVYLCTDAAANINGRDFIVGGGEISLVSLPDKERTIYCEDAWTVDQLEKLFPRTLSAGLKNLALT
jgi:hypothetical protein